MKEIIKAQGGKIDSSEKIPRAPLKKDFKAGNGGIIEEINIRELTKIARMSGAPANKTAGIMLHKVAGEKAAEGEVLMTIYAENKDKLASAESYALKIMPFRFKKIILRTIK
ncbi:AMP phosphorylase [uncultured archaeon]|nr:AMP phosphorylase [uncultured archaeon]